MESLPRLSDYAAHYAGSTPDIVAAADEGGSLTYRELASEVERVERLLLSLGVRHGDRVATLATPGNSYYVIFLAAIGIGAVWVGLNPRYRYDEIHYIVSDSTPKVVFHLRSFEGRSYEEDFARLAREVAAVEHVIPIEAGPRSIGGGTVPDDVLARARDAVLPMDPAIVVYTSGSTGSPKGAVLTHFGLVYGAVAMTQRFGVGRLETICPFPIDHVGCVSDLTANTLVTGGTLTFQARFDPGTMLREIGAGKANAIISVPTMIQLFMAHPTFAKTDFSKVEFILWGGAPMPKREIERLVPLGARLAVVYGMTEAAANTTFTDEGASVDVLFETVGKPLPAFPTRIAEGSRPCAVGESGEIQHHGPYLTLGYVNRPDATREAFTDDGWYRSGDVGFWREDGNIQVVGRMKEMFKSGGYNVYPREIEIAIERHPAVALAAVVAIPDPLYHEVGVAFIMPAPGDPPTADELRAFSREHLANYKVPKRFIVREDLPRLPVGKVDKVALRKELLG
ncbi:MAG: AMP-binding protein [Gemmatimonadota bacterium]